MGLCLSTSSKQTHALNERSSRIRKKVGESLKKIQISQRAAIAAAQANGGLLPNDSDSTSSSFIGAGGNPMTLEKIILKFDKCRPVLKLIKNVFLEISSSEGKSSLDINGLTRAMKKLHGDMSDEDVRSLFDFIDLDTSHEIEIKEFLVALVIGYILDVVPDKKNEQNSSNSSNSKNNNSNGNDDSATAPIRSRDSLVSVNNLLTKDSEMKEMMTLIVSAHLLFDNNATGQIFRKDVEKILGAQDAQSSKKTRTKTNPLLNDDRWNNMDWNSDGSIDFAEFVWSFCSWIDIDDDMDDDIE